MTDTERALMSIQTLFNKFTILIRKRSDLAKDSGHQIEYQALEMLRSGFFEFRFEVEKKFAKLGLQQFCGLSAFSSKARKEIEKKK